MRWWEPGNQSARSPFRLRQRRSSGATQRSPCCSPPGNRRLRERPGRVIAGEAGIGKSRIAAEARRRIHQVAAGLATALSFHCSPYHVNEPLYPIIKELRRSARLDWAAGPRENSTGLPMPWQRASGGAARRRAARRSARPRRPTTVSRHQAPERRSNAPSPSKRCRMARPPGSSGEWHLYRFRRRTMGRSDDQAPGSAGSRGGRASRRPWSSSRCATRNSPPAISLRDGLAAGRRRHVQSAKYVSSTRLRRGSGQCHGRSRPLDDARLAAVLACSEEIPLYIEELVKSVVAGADLSPADGADESGGAEHAARRTHGAARPTGRGESGRAARCGIGHDFRCRC